MRTKLSKLLLGGTHGSFIDGAKHRAGSLYIPALDENDHDRYIQYNPADGLIVYLLKRIEKLEKSRARDYFKLDEKIDKLKPKKKKAKKRK